MAYTERFEEVHQLLAGFEAGARIPGVWATPWIDVENFHRVIALFSVGAMDAGATVDVELREATSNAGAGAQTLIAGTQLTQAGGDAISYTTVGAQSENFTTNTRYKFVQLQVTVAVNNVNFAACLLGFQPRYAPVVNAWDENANA
jgi:hypothetical protein